MAASSAFNESSSSLLVALASMMVILVAINANLSHGQQQVRSNIGSGTTTVVLSESPNGIGLAAGDRSSSRQTRTISGANDNNLEVNSQEAELNGVQEEQVVAGLLEWLKKKKREKEEKKRPQPIILPVPVQPQPLLPPPYKQERKEIHIHINNHVKKDHHKRQPKKHHKQHYEHYHDGDYHDQHDKYYMGKYHAPLLSHHYSFDHFDVGGHHYDHYGDSGHHHDQGGDDYHAGYESQLAPQFSKAGGNSTTNRSLVGGSPRGGYERASREARRQAF